MNAQGKGTSGTLKDMNKDTFDRRYVMTGLQEAATGCLYSNNSHSDPILRTRKRRLRVDNNGTTKTNVEDCCNESSIRKTIRWDWNGTVNVSRPQHDKEAVANTDTAVKYPFKCRLTMSGTNVLSGMQALMDQGYIKKSDASTTIPHYVQAVMSASQGNLLFGDNNKEATVRIENGDIMLRRN